MKPDVTLTITALLTVLLSSFHLADDVVLGIEPGGTLNYIGVLIVAVFLCATLMLDGRRWAHLIVLIGSIGGAGVPYFHMTGVGMVGGKAANAWKIFLDLDTAGARRDRTRDRRPGSARIVEPALGAADVGPAGSRRSSARPVSIGLLFRMAKQRTLTDKSLGKSLAVEALETARLRGSAEDASRGDDRSAVSRRDHAAQLADAAAAKGPRRLCAPGIH